MNIIRNTSNPAFSESSLKDVNFGYSGVDGIMTLNGTVNKTFISLLILLASATFVWNKSFEGEDVYMYMMGGFFVTIASFLFIIFNKRLVHIFVPIYAVAEGLLLGGISSLMEMRYPGIAFQAVGLTIGTFLFMLFAYKTGTIRATEKFKSIMTVAIGGVCLVYFVGMILSMFGVNMFFHGNSMISIVFSLVVVVIAALSLILDFSRVEESVSNGAPKYMEWYCAFGLMVTLVWLYMEILRLLSKLQSRE
ncbi:Bax inhibitor-1/YccA family protein [Ichthyobacterium seriolicida]|uniref:Bax inhibitor-1/YccA family protein n=1 Tax=Ichthyobacterium seriolicida TaxID=242600 RepID=A0A1J1E052_9FLAO|nr:Bax inhibitor-1/YccA family protein [Ichthyobacterium seriolicida]BAV94309.1 hypothetical protein JBKA6_0296 [Ichthyobacterium seriolicida]